MARRVDEIERNPVRAEVDHIRRWFVRREEHAAGEEIRAVDPQHAELEERWFHEEEPGPAVEHVYVLVEAVGRIEAQPGRVELDPDRSAFQSLPGPDHVDVVTRKG